MALDYTLIDRFILEYLSKYHTHFGIEEITFFHGIETLENIHYFDNPEQIARQANMEAKENIEKLVSEYEFPGVKTEVFLSDQPPMHAIVELAVTKQFDLVVLGRKNSLQGSGISASHIARNSPTNILFIPQYLNPSLSKILVPLDFSNHSVISLTYAHSIADTIDAGVSPIHAYDVPFGYSKIGKSFEEFDLIMQNHARNDFTSFKEKNSIEDGLNCDYVNCHDDSKSEAIYQYAVKTRSDLIILGSKGRTNSASILMGSCAEKLVNINSDIPLLIVKEEQENMSFLEALKSI